MILLQGLTKAEFAARDDENLAREVADYGHAALKRQPGTKYEYNNAGINTAGRIIEVVSGMPYAQFMQTRLFDPLGMKDTTYFPTHEQVQRLARCCKLSPDKKEWVQNDYYSANKTGIDGLALRILGSTDIVPTDLLANAGHGMIFTYKYHYAMPAGGLYSTAGGRRYVSEDAIKTMTTDQTTEITPDPKYGLGWELTPDAPGILGAGTYAHTGAIRTRFWIDPTNQLVMILLMQRGDLPHDDQLALYSTFLKGAIQKFGEAAAPKP
jgi:CubicO group peptidase (beta-lactamase class C family)